MSKGRTFLAAVVGSFVGIGTLVLFVWFANFTGKDAFAYSAFGGWLIGGFVAGLIAQTPGKGALAGFLTSVVGFIVNSLIIVLLTVVIGQTLLLLILEIFTLGLYDETTPIGTETMIIFILVGLLVSLIISAISAIPNVLAGLLGGIINNPDARNKDAYQDYPETSK